MKKIFLLLILGLISFSSSAQDIITLGGRVQSAINKMDLTEAYAIFYDNDGNPKDTIRANQGLTWRLNQIDTTAMFFYEVPRVDSTFVFDVVCEGFSPATVTYTLDKIGRNENFRQMPTVYLSRGVKLDEVTVNATKIKFYNHGDTLVYDATAFMLPEGSMLDALIAQLPGVELGTDGQIKVNGEYVESLLLDGRKFFDGNNNIMLENIAAYTVKNIKVYEAASAEDKAAGRDFNKVLTMDVRLKKEYNYGWLLNAQGGYGTENRYLGRLFAAWFNSQWQVALIGNLNNLNDNRTPGRNDTWTPDQMPSGQLRTSLVGLQYNYTSPDQRKMAQGSVNYRHRNDDTDRYTDRTNFLSTGNTFDKTFNNSHNKSDYFHTTHWMNFEYGTVGWGFGIDGNYTNGRNSANGLSGTFNENQDTISLSTLDAIYSAGDSRLLETIINRSKTRTDSWQKNYNFSVSPSISLMNKNLGGKFHLALGFSYDRSKTELWKDYEINYGPDNENPQKLRQYFDNTPNYSFGLSSSLSYNTSIIKRKVWLYLFYSYLFSETQKDSYMYALDRLNDMGVYGTLPSGYLATFDPNNSYKSKLLSNSHQLQTVFQFNEPITDDLKLQVQLTPQFGITHRNFNYWRDERDYHRSLTNFSVKVQGWFAGRVMFSFRKRGETNPKYTNDIRYGYQSDSKLPNMVDLVDVVNDSDPLNIYIGNPDLKQEWIQTHRITWNWNPASHTFMNTFHALYTYTNNALTQGYNYETATGIRYNKMYNISGNNSLQLTEDLKWEFGKSKQFTLSSTSELEFSKYGNMIGIDMLEPVPTSVKNRRISENFRLSWQIGNVANISLRCDYANRYTTSQQEGFSNLNANHINSGLSAQVNIPGGFSVNTDFMCYTRRGYGSELLDTTDPVWNIRLSYCPPRNTRWVFMADGFDMLHTLNNVSYAVTASGRTVSYTNALPRYFLFSVQYRLNIQPKKR